jgi:hypothetical protein
VVCRPGHNRRRGLIEWMRVTFRWKTSFCGRIVVSSRDNACTFGCTSSFSCRLFLCGRCRRQVVICRRCDHGQVYCGRDCALEVRRCSQREARRRYQATDRGRRMHAYRSREYRARGRGVTDQGQTPIHHPETGGAAARPAQPSARTAAEPITVCCRCGHPVSAMVRLSPIRRPRRRPVKALTAFSETDARRLCADSHRR